jgi:hypothetical protein
VKAKVGDDVAVSGGAAWLAFPPEWTRLYADGDVLR